MRTMYYDLDALEEYSKELGFKPSRISSDILEVSLIDDFVLVFMNWRNEEDTCIGFKETPWHTHGKLTLMLDDESYAEFDELEILQGIKDGNILLNEQYMNHHLRDRWLSYKNQNVDVQHIQPNEELRIRRVT